MQLGNYDVAIYVEYLARFCADNITDEMRQVVENYLDSDIKVSIIVRDLVSACKTKFESGNDLNTIKTLLSQELANLGIEDSFSLTEYDYFVSGYITSSFKNEVLFANTGDDRSSTVNKLTEMIAAFDLLSDSKNKVSVGTGIIRYAWLGKVVPLIPEQLLAVTEYLSQYDLTDPGLSDRLANSFSII